MSCPFNRDITTGDPFLDWLGSSTGKPLSFYEKRYKSEDTTASSAKVDKVSVTSTTQNNSVKYADTYSSSKQTSLLHTTFSNAKPHISGGYGMSYKKPTTQALQNANNQASYYRRNGTLLGYKQNAGGNKVKENKLYMFNGKPFNGEVKNFGGGGTTVYRGGKSVLSLPNWEWQGGR